MRRYYGPTRASGSGNWRVAWYDPPTVADGKGRKGNHSLGTPDRQAAEAVLARLRLQAATGAPVAAQYFPIGEAVRRYLETGRAWRFSTMEARRRELRSLLSQVAPGRALREVSSEELGRWMLAAHGSAKASHWNFVRRVLISFWRWCVGMGFCERVVPSGVAPRREVRREPRALSEGEENALILQLDDRMKDLMVVAIETGLRQACVTKLHASWVRDGWLEVPAGSTKSGRLLRAPLSVRAQHAIARALARVADAGGPSGRAFPFSTQLVRLRFRQAADRCGLYSLRFHDLRATFISRLRERGVRLEVAARLAGHSDPKVTLRHYAAVSEKDMKEAVQ